MRWIAFLAVTIGIVLSVTHGQEAPEKAAPKPRRQFDIDITLVEIDWNGETRRLAQPRIATVENHRAYFSDGGRQEVTDDADSPVKDVRSGTSLELCVKSRRNDCVLVEATLEVSQVLKSGKNELERVVRTFDVVKEMKLGAVHSYILERRGRGQTVLKIKVVEVNLLDVDQGARRER